MRIGIGLLSFLRFLGLYSGAVRLRHLDRLYTVGADVAILHRVL